jgi:hypothetical protein
VDTLAVLFDLRLLFIDLPHSRIAVRRTSDELVATFIPMHRTYICNDGIGIILGLGLDVRKDVQLLEIVGVVASEVPKAGLVEVSSHEEETLSRTELSPVDIAITARLLVSWTD